MKRSLGPESAPLSSLKCTPLFSVPRTEGFSVQTPNKRSHERSVNLRSKTLRCAHHHLHCLTPLESRYVWDIETQ